MTSVPRAAIRRTGARALLACALGILLAGACAAPSELRVMSFNIRYGTADDGEDSWSRRREPVVDLVREFGPDLLGLQEALRFQLDEIERDLPGYEEVGVGRDDGAEAGEYAAILFRAARLSLVSSGTFWFSDQPDLPGSVGWGARLPRICTWAVLADRETGREVLALNVHLDHESATSRARSAERIAERVAILGQGRPVVLTGDFNAGPQSSPLRFLLGASEDPGTRSDAGGPPSPALRDSFAQVHPDSSPAGTYHGFTGRPGGERIDLILVSAEWEVVTAAIHEASRDGRYPSDHFPVSAVLRMPR